MDVGVIGLGMGREHLKGYGAVPDVRIAAVADLDERRLDAAASEYGVANAFTDYRELLAMPGIAAVSIAVPNCLHRPLAIEALQAGKHVLVEKPMATSASEARDMVRVAQERGKTLAVSVNYRWSLAPDSAYLKEIIGEGKLGSIYYVRCVSLRQRTFLAGQKSWFSDRGLSGGGSLIDMGPHLLDLAMWLLDDYNPVSASGVVRTGVMVDTDVEDFATALMRFQGGATVALESTWASYTRPGVSITVMGSAGGAIWDFHAPAGQRLTLYGSVDGTLLEAKPVNVSLKHKPEASVQEHFVACIREGRVPANSAENGLAVMKVLDAIYESSTTGKDVHIS